MGAEFIRRPRETQNTFKTKVDFYDFFFLLGERKS